MQNDVFGHFLIAGLDKFLRDYFFAFFRPFGCEKARGITFTNIGIDAADEIDLIHLENMFNLLMNVFYKEIGCFFNLYFIRVKMY